MDDKRLEKIKRDKRQKNDDISFLLDTIEEKDKKIKSLEKKTGVLSQQNLEMAAEMENVRSDFGQDLR